MNKLADEAAYFGAVADGVESQQEKIANLEKQLADKQKELADLTTERDTFYMTYRITCDEDTKKLEQQLAEFKHGHEVAELKAMFAELDRVATHNYAIKDAEIAELREQLANALAANEHNLKVYHAAAAELRQQLAERDAELEAERQRRWEGNRISSAELAASQKQVDALLNGVSGSFGG